MTVSVRPIKPQDADGFVAVFEAVAAEGKWIGTELPVDDGRKARWRASAEQPSDGAFTNVAIDGDRVVGFAFSYLERGRAHVGMAIVDAYRGQGLGKQLLAGCIDWARDRGAHKIDLEVWPHNTAARRLYDGAGFVEEGLRRRHWRRNSGELWDSIEMSLILDEESPGSPYPPRSTPMADRAQAVADELAIRTVLHRYCKHLDERRPDLVAREVFTPDAIDDRGRAPVPTGHAEIEAMFRSALDALDATAHVLGSIAIEVDGDSATSEAYVTAWHWLRAPAGADATRPADFALVCVYLDDFVRTAVGWRVRHRRLRVVGPGGVATGILPERFRGFGGIR